MTDWHLEVTSWRDVTPGATHYYANIRDDDWNERYEVIRVLDAVGAAKMSTDDFSWHAGDDTGRFESHEEMMSAALERFEEVAASGDTLWNRSPIYVERAILAVRPESAS